MLVKFKYEIQKQSLPKWTGGMRWANLVRQPPPPPLSPPPLPYAILRSTPCNAVISMDNMVGYFNEVFLSAGKRVEAENTLDTLVCRLFKCTCSQHASYDWNSMSALASLVKVLHALSDD